MYTDHEYFVNGDTETSTEYDPGLDNNAKNAPGHCDGTSNLETKGSGT